MPSAANSISLKFVARRLSQGAAEHRGVEGYEHSGAASSDDLGRQLLIGRAGCVPYAFDQLCLERCGDVLPNTVAVELVGRQSPGAARGSLRADASGIDPFVDGLWCDAIPCSDLGR